MPCWLLLLSFKVIRPSIHRSLLYSMLWRANSTRRRSRATCTRVWWGAPLQPTTSRRLPRRSRGSPQSQSSLSHSPSPSLRGPPSHRPPSSVSSTAWPLAELAASILDYFTFLPELFHTSHSRQINAVYRQSIGQLWQTVSDIISYPEIEPTNFTVAL